MRLLKLLYEGDNGVDTVNALTLIREIDRIGSNELPHQTSNDEYKKLLKKTEYASLLEKLGIKVDYDKIDILNIKEKLTNLLKNGINNV